ncbi:MAG: DNA mismatch repair protein MutS [Saprospiraceae bacterium]|nr:DNA mismatch repair protein MutS [Saprospiraceae bacterium]NNK90413.1 DNA mismatch repair protein MutS [Saprospiraceae bacterium]
MKQYFDIKRKHPDALLLFRVGDFYETFGEDAIKASHILGIILTKRNNGGSNIELAGFPHHSLDLYLPKLVKAGYRVAICEQLEKPSKEKKIVRRDVTEVVTPGVTTNESILDSSQNNFLASLFFEDNKIGIAFLDISTGEFIVHQGNRHSIEKLIQSFEPNEVLYSKKQKGQLEEILDSSVYKFGLDEWFFDADYNRDILLEHFKVVSLKGLGLEELGLAQVASGTILHYLSTIQQRNISHIHQVTRVQSDKYMWLDRFTIRNLELVRSNHESGISLLEVIDRTKTPMGARMLSKWMVLPLKSISEIEQRLDCVETLYEDESLRENLGEQLKKVGDLERMTSRIPMGKINPREFLGIRNTLRVVEKLKESVLVKQSNPIFTKLVQGLDECRKFTELIENSIDEDAPVLLKKGQVIKEGWNEELDEWRHVSNNAKDLLIKLQTKEIQNTGITGLKVGFNNVFGYYLEVTNKYKDQDLIPENWIRKQTLKGSERYITPELKELESKILQAQEKISELEEKLFIELVAKSAGYVSTLLNNANILAQLDCFYSFSELAEKGQYVRPKINDSLVLDIKAGRHPVIETQLEADKPYVPNDVYLDPERQQIIMITGPNMSGKSAVLRQTALITLLAHMGCYVPAESASIGIVDKIFTRVGASDNISSGESTFMVEMNETASILNNLSARSLIILDEIGRGTSTYDGISIAWAIAEYLHDDGHLRPKTLFATHYHELNQLAESFERIKNYNVATKEVEDKVIFLRKLVPGSCESSFGIHVAQMAGMPSSLVKNANALLRELESKSVHQKSEIQSAIQDHQTSSSFQLDIFDKGDSEWLEIKAELEKLDIQSMTPIECMLKLKELSEKIKGDQ